MPDQNSIVSSSILQEQVVATTSGSQTQQTGKKPNTKRAAESKKLVFLSNKVLEEVMKKNETTGTKIAMKILEIYKDKKINMDFKNVQRRVYDALNVLSALNIIKKDRNKIKFKGSPFINGKGIEGLIGPTQSIQSRLLEEKQERELQLLKKKERIALLDKLIEQKQGQMKDESQLLKEKVLQHVAIKKIIPRNFNSDTHHHLQKVPIPFVGFKMEQQHSSQKILLQLSQDKDILSMHSEIPVTAFTENDIFEGMGIRQTKNMEIIDLIQPKHLQFVNKVLDRKPLPVNALNSTGTIKGNETNIASLNATVTDATNSNMDNQVCTMKGYSLSVPNSQSSVQKSYSTKKCDLNSADSSIMANKTPQAKLSQNTNQSVSIN